MLFSEHLAVVRGGGDLASGVIAQLHRAGFPVAVLELDIPLTIRRAVAFSTAISEGSTTVDGIHGVRVDSAAEAEEISRQGVVAVLADASLPEFSTSRSVVIDARMAKRNLGTGLDDGEFVVALGPGFTAGVDCDAVIETQRGHRLGRVIWNGAAAPDSGVPGVLGGASAERVMRAPHDGSVRWSVEIGDVVSESASMGMIGETVLSAPLAGVVRGLITEGFAVSEGLKIADVDPRGDRAACFEISDKARLVGAGALEAVLTWLNQSS